MSTTVSRETLSQTRVLYEKWREPFEAYLDQLLWWNSRVNLVSRDVSRETLKEHVVHSLLPLSLELIRPGVWLDAGSGGGLPGIPISITRAESEFLLNDIVKKKCAAMRQIVHRIGLENTNVKCGDLRQLSVDGPVNVVSKHAFSVGDLLEAVKGMDWRSVVMYKGFEEALSELDQYEAFTKNSDMQFDRKIFRFEFGENEPFYKQKSILLLKKVR